MTKNDKISNIVYIILKIFRIIFIVIATISICFQILRYLIEPTVSYQSTVFLDILRKYGEEHAVGIYRTVSAFKVYVIEPLNIILNGIISDPDYIIVGVFALIGFNYALIFGLSILFYKQIIYFPIRVFWLSHKLLNSIISYLGLGFFRLFLVIWVILILYRIIFYGFYLTEIIPLSFLYNTDTMFNDNL